jgi:hypothetical protein
MQFVPAAPPLDGFPQLLRSELLQFRNVAEPKPRSQILDSVNVGEQFEVATERNLKRVGPGWDRQR